MYRETYNLLSVVALTREQRSRTCGYWYTVSNGHMAHTAFRTRAALDKWLLDRGLTLPTPLPAQVGTWAAVDLTGQHYHRELVLCDASTWHHIPGLPLVEMDNGEHVLAKWHAADRVLYVPNCNCVWRQVIPYALASAINDLGHEPDHALAVTAKHARAALYNSVRGAA